MSIARYMLDGMQAHAVSKRTQEIITHLREKGFADAANQVAWWFLGEAPTVPAPSAIDPAGELDEWSETMLDDWEHGRSAKGDSEVDK